MLRRRERHAGAALPLANQGCSIAASIMIAVSEAVTARQAASLGRSGIELQRLLELLDTEINAFNDLIATYCRGLTTAIPSRDERRSTA